MLNKIRTYIYKVRIQRHLLAAWVYEEQANALEERTPPSRDDEFYRYGEALSRLRSQRHADRAAVLIERHLDGEK